MKIYKIEYDKKCKNIIFKYRRQNISNDILLAIHYANKREINSFFSFFVPRETIICNNDKSVIFKESVYTSILPEFFELKIENAKDLKKLELKKICEKLLSY